VNESKKLQVEFPLDDDIVVECFNCFHPLRIKRGTEVDRYWHCDPRPWQLGVACRPTEEQMDKYMQKLRSGT